MKDESRRLDGCAVAVTGGPGYGREFDDGLLLLLLLPDRWKSGERPD
jgi:MYXO-CTERM domain-containing protein